MSDAEVAWSIGLRIIIVLYAAIGVWWVARYGSKAPNAVAVGIACVVGTVFVLGSIVDVMADRERRGSK